MRGAIGVVARALLVFAVAALLVAGVATIMGAPAVSRSAGTFAWAAALGGSSLALLAGVGRTEVQP
jgi:hypothetical protein